jgi:hypothetical protein
LENIISELIWYYSIISALLTECESYRVMRGADTDPWSHPVGLSRCDLGSGSQIPVRQKVRNACHGGTIWPWLSVRLWGCTTLKIGKPSNEVANFGSCLNVATA